MVYQLNLEAIDWDGNNFGRSVQALRIPDFFGTFPILGLKAFPLSFHPRKSEVQELLISRGRRFEELAGSHYKQYDGFAVSWDKSGQEIPFHCQGRIVVDSDCFRRFAPQNMTGIEPLSAKEGAQVPDCLQNKADVDDTLSTKYVFGQRTEEDRLCLTEEHHLTCLPRVRGYSLKKKQWALFYLDSIEDIKFNGNAFESLVLPEDQKELILSFAESQAMNHTGFDDVISGKGRGHITLLSGPPGVGKVSRVQCYKNTIMLSFISDAYRRVRSRTHAGTAFHDVCW